MASPKRSPGVRGVEWLAGISVRDWCSPPIKPAGSLDGYLVSAAATASRAYSRIASLKSPIVIVILLARQAGLSSHGSAGSPSVSVVVSAMFIISSIAQLYLVKTRITKAWMSTCDIARLAIEAPNITSHSLAKSPARDDALFLPMSIGWVRPTQPQRATTPERALEAMPAATDMVQ